MPGSSSTPLLPSSSGTALVAMPERLSTPARLRALHAFAEPPVLTKLDQLAVPRQVVLTRHKTRFLNPLALPQREVLSDPSPHLRQDTASVAYRAIDRAAGSSLANPAGFHISTSKLDLPLQATTRPNYASGGPPRSAQRVGDSLFRSRTLESLHASTSNLRSSRSLASLDSLTNRQSSRASDARYRNRAQSVTGGAPLSPAIEYRLHALQVRQLKTVLASRPA